MAILSLPIILGDGIEPSRPGLRTDFPIYITLVLRLERLRLCQGVRTEFTIRRDADDLLPDFHARSYGSILDDRKLR